MTKRKFFSRLAAGAAAVIAAPLLSLAKAVDPKPMPQTGFAWESVEVNYYMDLQTGIQMRRVIYRNSKGQSEVTILRAGDDDFHADRTIYLGRHPDFV